MLKISTITAKIKQTKAIKIWFREQSKRALEIYNKCLDLQFERASFGQKIYTAFDFANHFRHDILGSDYKDRIFERVADSSRKWMKSELLRYAIYWDHKAENLNENYTHEHKILHKYPFLVKTERQSTHYQEYKSHIKSLSRKQKITGKPRKRKRCSLAFSIRKNRQNTIQIKRAKLIFEIPKFKNALSGKYNFLPTESKYQFKLGTLKMDSCNTLWLKLTIEEELPSIIQDQTLNKSKILVGVDMGLKTTRTAVAVNDVRLEIIAVHNPNRQRFFDQSYNALVWASNHDRRHLPFVYRKIARRRLDFIDKDIVKILNMGDEFKFGKPSSAFLFSGRLARSASDAANSLFLTRFAKRAELAGKKAGEVNESRTSITCRKCGAHRPMPLHVRIFECFSCDHKEDRDVNAAYQIAFCDFLGDDKSIQHIKQNTNGVLSRREMKPSVRLMEDFQAQTPSQARDFSRAWGRAD